MTEIDWLANRNTPAMLKWLLDPEKGWQPSERKLRLVWTEFLAPLELEKTEHPERILEGIANRTISLLPDPPPPLTPEMIRDIMGNPFRPVPPCEPSWLTPTVRQVALDIYEARGFDGLPVLADALEEAGCTLKRVLDHLRDKVTFHEITCPHCQWHPRATAKCSRCRGTGILRVREVPPKAHVRGCWALDLILGLE